MPRIRYHAQNFASPTPPTLTAGHHELACTWAELLWAAITTRRMNRQHVLRHGRHSWFEMLYRAALVYANLLEQGNRFRRTTAFRTLDPSEKGAVSYFLGLTAGKLFAEKLRDTPWLMHLDVYWNVLQPATLVGGVKPDLVGLNLTLDWVVMEAKGRSNRPPAALVAKAKHQTQQLTSVAGQAPSRRVASVAYFAANEFKLTVEDPPQGPPRMRLPVAMDDFLRDYYRPFIELISQHPDRVSRRTVGTSSIVMVRLDEVDIEVGLDERVERIIRDPASHPARELIALPPNPAVATPSPRVYEGSDRVRVELGRDWLRMDQAPPVRRARGHGVQKAN